MKHQIGSVDLEPPPALGRNPEELKHFVLE
jgi:hypothetical protein